MKTINTSNKVYELYWVAGQVVSAGKNMETRVQGGGGGSYGNGYTAAVRITSTTTVHDQIFLVDREGKEHAFQLQDFNVACRDGNDLSVIWAIKKGGAKGPYIVVHNRSTAQTFFNEKPLFGIFSYSILYPIGISILCLWLNSVLPLWWALPFVAFFAWWYLAKQQIKKFKTGTDFAGFN